VQSARRGEPEQPERERDYSVITDLPHLQALVTGVVRGDRVQNENEIIYGETMGRDGMRLTGSEPRFVTELLGPSSIDPSDFLGGRAVAVRDRAARHTSACHVNSPAKRRPACSTPRTKPATRASSRPSRPDHAAGHPSRTTRPVHRSDVDVDPTGPLAALRCKNDVLAYVAALLDSAATNLAAGGGTFPVVLPPGFAGFDTPAKVPPVHRGLAAKVDVYLAFRGYAPLGPVVSTIDATYLNSAQAALTGSFMVADASKLDLGPAHTYSSSTGDAQNGLWTRVLRRRPFGQTRVC